MRAGDFDSIRVSVGWPVKVESHENYGYPRSVLICCLGEFDLAPGHIEHKFCALIGGYEGDCEPLPRTGEIEFIVVLAVLLPVSVSACSWVRSMSAIFVLRCRQAAQKIRTGIQRHNTSLRQRPPKALEPGRAVSLTVCSMFGPLCNKRSRPVLKKPA